MSEYADTPIEEIRTSLTTVDISEAEFAEVTAMMTEFVGQIIRRADQMCEPRDVVESFG